MYGEADCFNLAGAVNENDSASWKLDICRREVLGGNEDEQFGSNAVRAEACDNARDSYRRAIKGYGKCFTMLCLKTLQGWWCFRRWRLSDWRAWASERRKSLIAEWSKCVINRYWEIWEDAAGERRSNESNDMVCSISKHDLESSEDEERFVC